MPSVRRYLLDTNISSYIIKQNGPIIRERLKCVPISRICISAITEAELLFGVARMPGATSLRSAVDAFLAHTDILAWGSHAARCYANLRARLEQRGLPLGNMDMLIAAHALATDAILITSDRAFKNVKQLRLEDWTKRRPARRG